MNHEEIFNQIRDLEVDLKINPSQYLINSENLLEIIIKTNEQIISEHKDYSNLSSPEIMALMSIFNGFFISLHMELESRKEYKYELKREIKNILGEC